MAIEKYRVRDVARDFGMPAKVITEILDKYATAPKSNMQALEDHELSIVFEHLTQNNQISNIAAIYADEPKKPEAPQAEAPKTEVPKAQPAEAEQKEAPVAKSKRVHPDPKKPSKPRKAKKVDLKALLEEDNFKESKYDDEELHRMQQAERGGRKDKGDSKASFLKGFQ